MVANAKVASSKKTAVKKPQAKISTKEISSEKKSFKTFVKSFNGLLTDMPIIGRCVAEFIGTMLLAVAFIETQSSPLLVPFALVGILLIVGGFAGVHINPAVTVASWISRKTKGAHAVLYIIAQLLGACAAWLIISAFVNSLSADSTTTSTVFHAATIDGNEWYLFFAELVGTFILGLGFAAALSNKKDKTTSALTIAFGALVALYLAMSLTSVLLTEQYTGFTFLNPALAFAMNGLSFNIWPIAIYVLAPVLGAVVSFGVYELIKDRTEK